MIRARADCQVNFTVLSLTRQVDDPLTLGVTIAPFLFPIGSNAPFCPSPGSPATVRNRGNIIATIGQPTFYTFGFAAPPASLVEVFTFEWTGISTNVSIALLPGVFPGPLGQAAVVGGSAVFIAQPLHATQLQWRKDGSNLVEGAHFIGVTNATLTILNVQPMDAGNYSIVTGNSAFPLGTTNSATSSNATLTVFKPVRLAITKPQTGGAASVFVNNQDQTPMEVARVPKFDLFTTTNVALNFINWLVVTNVSTNFSGGSLRFDLPAGGSQQFIRLRERP